MKKLTLLLLLVVITNFSIIKAQGLFWETGLYETRNLWSGYSYYLQGNTFVHSKSYKAMLEKTKIIGYEHTTYKIKKNEKIKRFSEVVKFDNNYNLLDRNNGKKHYIYTYNKNNKFTDYKYIKKGSKLKTHEIIEYTDSNKITKYVYYKHNGKKMKRKWIAEYDKDQKKILTKVYYNKDGVTETKHWDYIYYEDGKRKQTKFYTKGELKHIWNYTCDDEGKEQKKDVKTTQVCHIKEYLEDSSYIVVNRTTDDKGRIRKNVSKYNKDKKLIEYRSYNNKGKLVWGHDYRRDCNGKLIQTINYRRGGLIRSKEEWFYNNDLVVKYKKYKRKGKLNYSVEYKYNNNKLRTERISFDKRHRQTRKYKYEYDDKQNIVKTTSFNSKDEPTYVYETSYTYKK